MAYVTPTKVLGADGSVHDVVSPMTAVISIPYAERTVSEAAQAIFNAVYKVTGLKIAIGTFPYWPSETVQFGVSAAAARDALAKLFSQAGKGPMSYRLTFDPKPDRMRIFDYMINVKPAAYVTPTAPSSPAPAPSGAAPAPHPGNSPGFVKAKP